MMSSNVDPCLVEQSDPESGRMMIMELPQSLVPIARTFFLHQEVDDCEFDTDLIYVDRETTPWISAEDKSTERTDEGATHYPWEEGHTHEEVTVEESGTIPGFVRSSQEVDKLMNPRPCKKRKTKLGPRARIEPPNESAVKGAEELLQEAILLVEKGEDMKMRLTIGRTSPSDTDDPVVVISNSKKIEDLAASIIALLRRKPSTNAQLCESIGHAVNRRRVSAVMSVLRALGLVYGCGDKRKNLKYHYDETQAALLSRLKKFGRYYLRLKAMKAKLRACYSHLLETHRGNPPSGSPQGTDYDYRDDNDDDSDNNDDGNNYYASADGGDGDGRPLGPLLSLLIEDVSVRETVMDLVSRGEIVSHQDILDSLECERRLIIGRRATPTPTPSGTTPTAAAAFVATTLSSSSSSSSAMGCNDNNKNNNNDDDDHDDDHDDYAQQEGRYDDGDGDDGDDDDGDGDDGDGDDGDGDDGDGDLDLFCDEEPMVVIHS